jgi:DnaJ-class molecular chaperone
VPALFEGDLAMSILACIRCQGDGGTISSPCEACEGSGNHTCDRKFCRDKAIGFNDDGEALYEDHLQEWMENFEP